MHFSQRSNLPLILLLQLRLPIEVPTEKEIRLERRRRNSSSSSAARHRSASTSRAHPSPADADTRLHTRRRESEDTSSSVAESSSIDKTPGVRQDPNPAHMLQNTHNQSTSDLHRTPHQHNAPLPPPSSHSAPPAHGQFGILTQNPMAQPNVVPQLQPEEDMFPQSSQVNSSNPMFVK